MKILFDINSWQTPAPYGSKLHILHTNDHFYHFLAACSTRAIQKKPYLLTKCAGEFSGKKRQDNGPFAEEQGGSGGGGREGGGGNDRTEKATGLSRKNAREVGKRNQMKDDN